MITSAKEPTLYRFPNCITTCVVCNQEVGGYAERLAVFSLGETTSEYVTGRKETLPHQCVPIATKAIVYINGGLQVLEEKGGSLPWLLTEAGYEHLIYLPPDSGLYHLTVSFYIEFQQASGISHLIPYQARDIVWRRLTNKELLRFSKGEAILS